MKPLQGVKLPSNYAGEWRYGRGVFSSAVRAMLAYEEKMTQVYDAITSMACDFSHSIDLRQWTVYALAWMDRRFVPFRVTSRLAHASGASRRLYIATVETKLEKQLHAAACAEVRQWLLPQGRVRGVGESR